MVLIAVCGGSCDSTDPSATGRHALIAALSLIGIEADEDYLGAGCTAVTVPTLDGDWSFVNADHYDVYPNWGVEFHPTGGGATCSHELNPTTDPPEVVALIVRDRFMAHHERWCDGAV